MMRRPIALLAVATLGLAGCGDSEPAAEQQPKHDAAYFERVRAQTIDLATQNGYSADDSIIRSMADARVLMLTEGDSDSTTTTRQKDAGRRLGEAYVAGMFTYPNLGTATMLVEGLPVLLKGASPEACRAATRAAGDAFAGHAEELGASGALSAEQVMATIAGFGKQAEAC